MTVADMNVLRAARSRQSLRFFMEEMTIASRPKPRRFGDVADPWQWDLLGKIIEAVEVIAGLRTGKLRYDLIGAFMHKGADKTSAAARAATWGICYSPTPLEFVVIARDRDQARSLRDAMAQEKALNPWLPSTYKINNYDAEGPSGTVEILSSDAKGGHGKRGNVYVMDEWAMWRDRELSDMVITSAGKYEDCLVVILSNCGYKQSFQYPIVQEMMKDPRCYIYQPPGIIASWIDKKKIERLRRHISPSEGRRLYDNIWVDAGEDAAFPEELVNEMFRLTSPHEFVMPRLEDEEVLVP